MKKVKTIVAIGGGEIGDFETLPIDCKIVEYCGKKHPKVLFVPTASGDALGYWETFQKVYRGKLKCEVDVLFLLSEELSKEQIEQKIFSADIVYVGGGSTLKMLQAWRKFGVDLMFKKAYDKGIILSGISAGAICWFRYGSSDSRSFMENSKKSKSFMRVSGLDLLPITLSPHHIREKEMRNRGMKEMMQRTTGIGIMVDDGAAIAIRNDKYEILKADKNIGIKKIYNKNKKIVIGELPVSGTISDLISKK